MLRKGDRFEGVLGSLLDERWGFWEGKDSRI